MSAFDPKRTSLVRPDTMPLSSASGEAMRRSEFIRLLSVVAMWPLAVHAQQPALPVVAFVRDGSPEANARYVAAFRKGLNESGYVEGQNVTIEYHWLEGQYDRLRRRRGPGQAWFGRQSCPAWWQRNRQQFSRPGNGGQAVAAPA